VLCSHQARAVSLDDLASPNPIVERTYGSTPDRSAGQAEQVAATIVNQMGRRRFAAPVAGVCLRVERDRPKGGPPRPYFCSCLKAPTTLTPDGTLEIKEPNLVAYSIRAIQELAARSDDPDSSQRLDAQLSEIDVLNTKIQSLQVLVAVLGLLTVFSIGLSLRRRP
jgi:hypothetical protein